MTGPYNFPTDRVTGGPAPAADMNAVGEALNEDLGVTGSVYFEGRNNGGGSVSSDGFNTYPINEIVSNIGGGAFNTGTGIFTVPADGLYDCRSTIRIADGSPERSVGVGIGDSNSDMPDFLWAEMGGTGTKGRSGRQYSRMTRFTAGQQLRLYIYSDGQTFNVSAGKLIILKVAN